MDQQPTLSAEYIENQRIKLCVLEMGENLTALANVVLQGARDDNRATRGGIAAGLERIARRLRSGANVPLPDHLEDVKKFHEKFDIRHDGSPGLVSEAYRASFFENIATKMQELNNACEAENINRILDALVDIDYFLKSFVYLSGFGEIYNQAWARVQDANMAKEKNDATGDIIKPANWPRPSFYDLIGQITAPKQGN